MSKPPIGLTIIEVRRSLDSDQTRWEIAGQTYSGEHKGWATWDFPISYAVCEAAQNVVQDRWGLLTWNELDPTRVYAIVSPEQTFAAMKRDG